MKVKIARDLSVLLAFVAVIIGLLFFEASAQKPVCKCTSDTQCMELCGGNGDPTPRKE